MGGYHIRRECSILLLENYTDYIVADMSLPLELLRIVFCVRQQRGYVKHDFTIFERFVNGSIASLAILYV